MTSERMTHSVAVGALLELTAAEWTDLLEGWDGTACEARDQTACTILSKSTGLGFVAVSKSPFDALLCAMALAIVAGEMALPRVKVTPPTVAKSRCRVRNNSRGCFRAADHDGDHEDSLGRWYEGANDDAQHE